MKPLAPGGLGVEAMPHPANPDTDPLIGTTIAGKYKVLGSVARGGMGRVYRAEQMPLGRSVALKTLSLRDLPEGGEASYRRRFELEASACSELSHPNTVRVFDYGFDGQLGYIVMELVAGVSLQRMVREHGPLSPERAMHIGRQLCGSLAEAHGRKIVHRDLKPGNIMICAQGDDPDFVKVVDFGIAKSGIDEDLTRIGQIIGSPHYIAPEQIRGKDVDGRADVYSLGVCLYFALTGRKPFEDAGSSVEVMIAQLGQESPKPAHLFAQMPDSLSWVISRCIERDRDARFEDVKELRRALRLCQEHRSGPAPPMTLTNGRLVGGPRTLDTGTLDVPGAHRSASDSGSHVMGSRPTGAAQRRVHQEQAMVVAAVGAMATLVLASVLLVMLVSAL